MSHKSPLGEWLPKEHGAYGQVALPLVTAFGVAGPSTAGVLLYVAVVAGFLAHEPAAILLGQRGARVRRELDASARRWLFTWLAIAVTTGLAAVIRLEPAVRWSVAVPAIPGVLLIMAMVTGREKSWYGESSAALTFAGVSVPVTMAAGASLPVALAVAIPFALLFTTTTLAVRVVILRVRGGGQPHAAAATRRATLVTSAMSIAVMGILIVAAWLRWSVLIASIPGLVTAAVIAARPPAPARLRYLGWLLVAISVLTGIIVVSTVA
jgi:hypothetical protein